METASGKPGWKTTEFWLNVATQMGTLWGAVHGFVPAEAAAIISIVGAAVYTVARTIVKAIADVKAARAQGAAPVEATATATVKPA